jgi:hypothetical protein
MSGMPVLYAALVLFGTWFLNLLFRKWFDLVLWPKIVDWWASWSQRRLENKIRKLERELQNPIKGEEVIIYGLRGLFQVLGYLLATILIMSPGAVPLPKMLVSTHPTTLPPSINYDEVLAWCRLVIISVTFLSGLWYAQGLFVRHMHWKYPAGYRDELEKRIANLKAKLK